ncbi:hypothetical protein [Myxococcus landrumensis]|uniref:Lipoprotein n=1 Tax=Myxococcus landrumensis TaxID=2813577 RepID=A0ABX7N5Y6_9BACT|nr:hypothetical protein [Myxococcus landrumus]QSQ13858.1 hypothetical protein JY572_36970 [Myxococcus landrumus]
MSFHLRTLLTVSIAHGYYAGACKDLGFVLPSETAKLLEGGRMVGRVREGMLYILFDADPQGSPLVSLAGKTLRLGLKQLNPQFANITAGLLRAPALSHQVNNGPVDQLGAPSQAVFVGQVFSHALTDAERPVTVSVRDAAGNTLRTQTVTAEDDRATVSFDLTGLPPGALTLRETSGLETVETACYLDPELQQEGAFAVLELRIDPGFYTTPPAFTVAYAARQETLKYYLVADNYTQAEAQLLSVTDTGFTEDGRPQLVFTRVSSQDFTPADLPAGLLGGGNAQVVLFKSQALVPRRQQARRKVQLVRTSTGDVLIDHLPQPGADSPHADLIIHVLKP